MNRYCLVSTSGDMSKYGISDHNTVYIFNPDHRVYIDKFLKAQLEYHLHCYSNNLETYKPYKKFINAFQKLKDLGFFTSKYDARTQWELQELHDLKDIQDLQPTMIGDNYD
tara:strand:+ start:1335 stop:1667 length:333 start_codon:yes stop_codon:yes gene_type:complete